MSTANKERPILFSAPMVRAILAGAKTQTRRVVKPQPQMVIDRISKTWDGPAHALQYQLERLGKGCPYGQPGDRLWVRETWQVARETLDYETGGEYDVWEWPDELGDPRQYLKGDARFGTKAGLFYCADGVDKNPSAFYDLVSFDNKPILRPKEINWRPSIHMPRWASRITLEITGVRVERLQDISEADAQAEGVQGHPFRPDDGWPICTGYMIGSDDGKTTLHPNPQDAYQRLWESINSPGSWDANPWVWVIEFRRVPAC